MAGKVQLFLEGHKKLHKLPHGFESYLVNVKTMRKIVQIFVTFLEKLTFTGTLDVNFSSMNELKCRYVQAWNSLSSSSLIIKNAGEPSSKEKKSWWRPDALHSQSELMQSERKQQKDNPRAFEKTYCSAQLWPALPCPALFCSE